MAANKKNAKSTKTAHVLNLLAGPGGETDTAPAAEGETPEAAPVPQSTRPLTPPILEVARSNDEQLSGQILQALEEELAEEPAAPAEAPAAPTAAESAAEEPAAEAAEEPAVPEEPAAEAVEEPASEEPSEEVLAAAAAVETPVKAVEEVVAQTLAEEMESQVELPHQDSADLPPEAMADIEPEPAPEAPERSYDPPVTMMEDPPVLTHGEDGGDPNDEELNYVNVMQILVEEKAPRYIEMFGLCPCRRCAVDVKALTLTNLVPKYVVMRKAEMIPMLTIYEGRYASTIFAQLTRACKLVMDHPHHGRD